MIQYQDQANEVVIQRFDDPERKQVDLVGSEKIELFLSLLFCLLVILIFLMFMSHKCTKICRARRQEELRRKQYREMEIQTEELDESELDPNNTNTSSLATTLSFHDQQQQQQQQELQQQQQHRNNLTELHLNANVHGVPGLPGVQGVQGGGGVRDGVQILYPRLLSDEDNYKMEKTSLNGYA